MIKIVQKKGKTKAKITGEAYEIGLEATHLIVRLVEGLVEANRPIGLAAASTVVKALKQRLPELRDFPETDVKEEGDKNNADDV